MAACAHPAGNSIGLAARKVPVTGCSCQKAAHIIMFMPPNALLLLSYLCLYVPLTRTASLTTRSRVPRSSADIMLTSSMIIKRVSFKKDCNAASAGESAPKFSRRAAPSPGLDEVVGGSGSLQTGEDAGAARDTM